MTIEFMQMVQSGACWLPRCSEISFLNCYDPPPKQYIAHTLYDLMVNQSATPSREWSNSFINTAQRIRKHPPSIMFMLGIISTMDKNNVLFAKHYVKPKRDERGNELSSEDEYVEDKNDFFTGLPLAPPLKGKKRSTVFFGDSSKKMAKKLERMEKQKSQLEQRIARQHGRAPQLLQEEQKGDGQQMMMVNNSFSSFTTAFSQLNTSNMLSTSNAQQVNTTADFGGPNVIGN